ncbi:hypothetical protein WJX73_005480 [Symbiochloris irregularis]|uniref:Glycosyltransferase 61 catalytic domain-containing protein n=1 Tax=Symbiochloris irregularis TaxID=706552 RepID=A0AAW1PAZ3_9CHLO
MQWRRTPRSRSRNASSSFNLLVTTTAGIFGFLLLIVLHSLLQPPDLVPFAKTTGSPLKAAFARPGGERQAQLDIIDCRRLRDAHMTPSSAPQVMCDASNLLIDPSKMTPARCPVHRPRYMCSQRTYNAYASGAFQVDCDWPQPQLDNYSRDHMRDIMASFTSLNPALDGQVHEVADNTLLVTRESQEHSNVFHMLTDLFNTYLALRMLAWLDPGQPPRRVLLLDNHPEGPLDGLWAGVAAGGGVPAMQAPWNATGVAGQPLLARASALPGPTRLRSAALVAPGYASLFFAHLYEPASCPHASELFAHFRRWVLRSLDLVPQAPVLRMAAVRVVYVSRQKSGKGRGKKVTRRVGNEAEIMAMLRQVPGTAPQLVDLAALSLLDQLSLLTTTDLLIAMHGAALAWTACSTGDGSPQMQTQVILAGHNLPLP